MRKAVVTVKCERVPFALDLELPVDADSCGVARSAALAFGQEGEYQVEACSLGRVLRSTETLAEAGVWDGAWLLLKMA